jgi:hypothetical protein
MGVGIYLIACLQGGEAPVRLECMDHDIFNTLLHADLLLAWSWVTARFRASHAGVPIVFERTIS